MTEEIANKKVKVAKAILLMKFPFVGLPCSKLKWAYNKAVPTACTDSVNIWYGDYFAKLTQPEVNFVAFHEVMHVLNKHVFNTPKVFDHKLANIAQDYVINLVGDKLCQEYPEHFKMPEGGLLDERYAGMDWVQVYRFLKADQDQEQNQDQDQGGDQQGGDQQGGDQQGEGNGKPSLSDMLEKMEDVGGCGTHCQPLDGEGKELSPAEKAKIEQECEILAQQATALAKSKGLGGAMLADFVETHKTTKVNWKRKFKQIVSSNKPNGRSTYERINRNTMSHRVKLPSKKSKSFGDIHVLMDTSGSQSDEQVNYCGSGVMEIMAQIKPDNVYVHYFCCDVYHTDHFKANDKFTYPKLRRGGTDFRTVQDTVLANAKRKPKMLVWMTDLCDTIPEDPKIKTLWCSTDRNQRRPNFGDYVEVIYQGE